MPNPNCPDCDKETIAVQVLWRYDGISHYLCKTCDSRYSRNTLTKLKDEELSDPWYIHTVKEIDTYTFKSLSKRPDVHTWD